MRPRRLRHPPERNAVLPTTLLAICCCTVALGMRAEFARCACPADTIGCPGPEPYRLETTVIQNPQRPGCLAGSQKIVRLCPAGDFDTLVVTVMPGLCGPFTDAPVTLVESVASLLNIAAGGATFDTTDTSGVATVKVFSAAGYGELDVCFCDWSGGTSAAVRSPDVAKGSLPALCGISTTTSFVNGADLLNPTCGFLVKFGTVTPGMNAVWDLNCDGVVNGVDIVGKGGFTTHFGHSAAVGAQSTCP